MQAIGIGIGSFSGLIIYDLICKSPLVKQPLLFALIGFVILTGLAYFYTKVLVRGRRTFISAMIGSLMVVMYFFVIIPAQKAMVNAAKKAIAIKTRS